MEANKEVPSQRERRWWPLALFLLAVFCAWGYFGTGLSTVVACRASGGTPTSMPTTMVLSSAPDSHPVPVVVPKCLK